MSFLGPFVVAFMAFLAIMNPLANLPVFLGLTAEDTPAERNRIASKSLLITFGIIAVFALGGKRIFEGFGITLPALRITGGALVFLIGFHMVQGKSSTVTHGPAQQDAAPASKAEAAAVAEKRMSVAVSPLAMPILAGPGTIATAMNVSAQEGWGGTIATLLSFAVLCLITWLVFRYGSKITAVLGKSAMDVVTRLMGLILAVIGVQMLVLGLTAAFPVLGHH